MNANLLGRALLAVLLLSACKKSTTSSSGGSPVKETVTGPIFDTGGMSVSFFNAPLSFKATAMVAVHDTAQHRFQVSGWGTDSDGDSATLTVYFPDTYLPGQTITLDGDAATLQYFGFLDHEPFGLSLSNANGTLSLTSLDTVHHQIGGSFTSTLFDQAQKLPGPGFTVSPIGTFTSTYNIQ